LAFCVFVPLTCLVFWLLRLPCGCEDGQHRRLSAWAAIKTFQISGNLTHHHLIVVLVNFLGNAITILPSLISGAPNQTTATHRLDRPHCAQAMVSRTSADAQGRPNKFTDVGVMGRYPAFLTAPADSAEKRD
jgi:hypothetical protein